MNNSDTPNENVSSEPGAKKVWQDPTIEQLAIGPNTKTGTTAKNQEKTFGGVTYKTAS